MKPRCRIRQNKKLRDSYEIRIAGLDPCFLQTKFSKPALRALIDNGILNASDLIKLNLSVAQSWHGIGPVAFEKLARLKQSLKKTGPE